MNRHSEILTKMHPNCFYRPKDLRSVECMNSIYSTLKSLTHGMCVDKIKDGHRTLYITRQEDLF